MIPAVAANISRVLVSTPVDLLKPQDTKSRARREEEEHHHHHHRHSAETEEQQEKGGKQEVAVKMMIIMAVIGIIFVGVIFLYFFY